MKVFWRAFDRLIEWMVGLAGIILVFITAAVCYSIGLRYLFTKTTIWLTQITEYALLWIVFLATTWLLREKGHITTDIIYAHLSEKAKWPLDCFIRILGGLTSAVLFGLGLIHFWDCLVNGVTDVRAVTVPKWLVFSIIPLGSLFLTLQFLRMAWEKLSEGKGGKP
jgi:TRAP-type C4-dicarboxylate transport system permease small subunit